jgi:UDP-N-acetylglucosamine 4,6-dehydratase
MKHVPAAEYNPVECIKTNVHGAENVVKASMRANVKKVIALSTDKAANPINLYGASKLASDKIFAAANNISGDGPRFAVVRYGNVIGSSGSIVPLYRKLISQGADALPVTDDRMTRFWITIEQGVDFVLSSLALMQGGEVFIPKIPSTKISDLCRVMAPDLPIKIIGIRPGEKLHEVMITDDDARNTLELDDRYIIKPCFAFWTDKPYEQIGATTVAGTFRYASDSNPEWLNDENLSALIARTNV